MFPVIFAVLLVAENVLSNPLANEYMDNVLSTTFVNAVKELNLDPAALPDFHAESLDEMPAKMNSDFFSGSLTGLSKAKRFSDCAFDPNSRAINCTISFNELKVHYDGKARFGEQPSVKLQGKGKLFPTVVFAEILHTPPKSAALNALSLEQLGTMRVQFSSSNDSLFTGYLRRTFKGHVQAKVYNLMSQKVQEAFSRAIYLASPPLF